MARNDVGILSELIKHMSMEEADPLSPLIDEYLIERETSPNRLREYRIPMIGRNRPGGRLSPSSIGGCKRQATLKFLGVEGQRKLDPDTEMIFDDGNWAHHKWQARFRDMEAVLGAKRFKVLGIERTVTIPELYIAGSFDALIKIAGKRWMIDFKTINSHGFGYVYREHKPKDAHVKQLITYCVAKGVKRGMLVYDNKDTPDYMVFTIEVRDADWMKVQRWCRKVLDSIKEQELPKKASDCNNGSFLFEHCPFSSFCFGKHADNEEKLRRLAFRNFEGIDEAWERGHASWN